MDFASTVIFLMCVGIVAAFVLMWTFAVYDSSRHENEKQILAIKHEQELQILDFKRSTELACIETRARVDRNAAASEKSHTTYGMTGKII